jgi:hypothetical protein
MAFPTIPTVAAGRILTAVQADTTATRTFPNLSGLTKNSGDLLIAIVYAYQSSATANAVWSGWTAGWTEFADFSTTTGIAIGAAYKFSTGSETGTISVTEAATITGHATMILLSIPGAHPSTPPEAGSFASGTSAAADPAAFDPGGWAAEETLWIAVGGTGENATTGSFTGTGSAPTNYTDFVATAISSDVVGGVDGAVAFRQLNATSENVGTFSVDTSNARNSALVIAVRPAVSTTVNADVASLTATANNATADVPAAPVVWLATDDITGLADADPVATWTAHAGTSNSVTAATTFQPSYQTNEQNGLPAVRFDGNDRMNKGSAPVGTNVQNFTIFAVVKPTTLAGSTRTIIVVGDGTGGRAWRLLANGQQNLVKANTADLATGTATRSVGNLEILAMSYASSGAINFYKGDGTGDGSASPAAASFTDTGADLNVGAHPDGGASEPWIGDIYEIRYFASVLSTTDRDAQFAQLQAKWAATSVNAQTIALTTTADDATVTTVAGGTGPAEPVAVTATASNTTIRTRLNTDWSDVAVATTYNVGEGPAEAGHSALAITAPDAAAGIAPPVDTTTLVTTANDPTYIATSGAGAQAIAATVTAYDAVGSTAAQGAGNAQTIALAATTNDATVSIAQPTDIALLSAQAEWYPDGYEDGYSGTLVGPFAKIGSAAETIVSTVTADNAGNSAAVSAESVATTAVANNATASTATQTTANADVANLTVTANDTSISVGQTASTIAAAGLANDATAQIGASADSATVAATSNDAVAGIAVQAESITAAATTNSISAQGAFGADSASIVANAENAIANSGPVAQTADAIGTSYDAVAQITSQGTGNADVSSATATANDASQAITQPANVAILSSQAENATASTGAQAEAITITATALDASQQIAVNAETIAASATADNATASTVTQTSANADVANSATTTNDATASVGANADIAVLNVVASATTVLVASADVINVAAIANDASASVAQPSEASALTATASSSIVDLGASPQESTGIATADTASQAIVQPAETISAAATANNATVSTATFTNGNADVALATTTANGATTTVVQPAEPITVTATSFDAQGTPAIQVQADAASYAISPLDAASSIGVGATEATVTLLAFDGALSVAAQTEAALIFAAAPQAAIGGLGSKIEILAGYPSYQLTGAYIKELTALAVP